MKSKGGRSLSIQTLGAGKAITRMGAERKFPQKDYHHLE